MVELSSFPLLAGEEGQSLAVVNNNGHEFVVVGTAFINSNESEPSRGRLIALQEEEHSQKYSQIAQSEIGGCPYALAALSDSRIAVALNSQVNSELHHIASFRLNNYLR